MKKIALWIISFTVLLTGCSMRLSDGSEDTRRTNWIDKKVSENNLVKLYESEENYIIYSKLPSIFYKENNVTIDLQAALENHQLTINDLISKLDLYLTSNDGGSLYYESNSNFDGEKFYLAKCNSSAENGGIKDIFIDSSKENILHYCVIED